MRQKEREQEQKKETKDAALRFFKIILPFPLTSEKLQIPPQFIKYIDKDVCEGAALRGPSGHCWPVKLYEDAKGMYLKDGWNQFFKDHSLGHLEFLLFIYDGKRCFDVRIFEKNGLERLNAYEDDAYIDSAPVEYYAANEVESERVKALMKRKQGRPRKYHVGLKQIEQGDGLHCHELKHSEKPEENQPLGVEIKEDIIELSDKETDIHSKKFKDLKSNQSESVECDVNQPSSLRKSPQNHGRDVSFAENDGLLSKFPSFQKYMHPYNIGRKSFFAIPSAFAVNMPHEKSTMTLINEDGKSWEVTYIPIKSKPLFSKGWAIFMLDNKLKLGDLCIFELVKKMEMQVYIVRST